MSNEELVEVFRSAVIAMLGTGAKGRSHYYEVREELMDRLGEVK